MSISDMTVSTRTPSKHACRARSHSANRIRPPEPQRALAILQVSTICNHVASINGDPRTVELHDCTHPDTQRQVKKTAIFEAIRTVLVMMAMEIRLEVEIGRVLDRCSTCVEPAVTDERANFRRSELSKRGKLGDAACVWSKGSPPLRALGSSSCRINHVEANGAATPLTSCAAGFLGPLPFVHCCHPRCF